MALHIGIDVGGTFTDICVWDDEVAGDTISTILKVPSSYPDPARGIFDGLKRLQLEDWGSVRRLVQGSTIATNALLERKGSSSAMLVTKGFRDLIEIGRQTRAELYNLQMDKPLAVVPRHLRFEIAERVASDGRVLTPLDTGSTPAIAAKLREAGVESLSICLLHSYRYPEHEQRLAALLREALPDVYISTSHTVHGEFREFERFNTTGVNAYLGPLLSHYVDDVQARSEALGIDAPTFYTHSNGGLIPPEIAKEFPCRLLLSGPAAGVAGAAFVAEQEGFEQVVTLDMGGTSTDVCLIKGGAPHTSHRRVIDGLDLSVPAYDIETVGAGGGSIAYIDDSGLLKVGPRSAGSSPGPAAYGKGGLEPTVTDAHVVIGSLHPGHPLGGDLLLDVNAARRVVADLSEQIGLSVEETALGIIRVAVMNMVRAVRVITVRKGEDPRDYALLPFGGAGPMHACWLADELGVSSVLVPPAPGVLSAYGQQVADLRFDFSRSEIVSAERSADSVARAARLTKELEATALNWIDRVAADRGGFRLHWSVDMRYQRQNHEITVPWIELAVASDVDVNSMDALIERFFELHELTFGHASRREPVSMVTHRLAVVGSSGRKPRLMTPAGRPGVGADTPRTRLYLGAEMGWTDCDIFDRTDLASGDRIVGPALILQFDATTTVLPGFVATQSSGGCLVLAREA